MVSNFEIWLLKIDKKNQSFTFWNGQNQNLDSFGGVKLGKCMAIAATFYDEFRAILDLRPLRFIKPF